MPYPTRLSLQMASWYTTMNSTVYTNTLTMMPSNSRSYLNSPNRIDVGNGGGMVGLGHNMQHYRLAKTQELMYSCTQR